MPYKSPFQIDIPATDVLSYLFPQGHSPSDKPIWIDAESPQANSLSPKRLLEWVKRLGVALDNLGLRQNDVVMTFSSNHIFVPCAYLGTAGSGRIFSGCNPAYGVAEVAYQIESTGARLLLVEPPLLGVALEAASKTKFSKNMIYLFSDNQCDPVQGVRDWSAMLPSAEESQNWQWHRMDRDESRTRIAVLNYSSGTTGLPKGVMISHQNVIANVEQSLFMRDLEQTKKTSPGSERWLGFLPLYHAFGQLWSIVAAGKALMPCFYMRSFNYLQFLNYIQHYKITHLQTAPPLLVMLAKRPESQKFNLSSLENILCGAAPLSKELQNEVSDRFKLKVVQTWGMTELTCSCLHVPGGRDDRSGSVGLIDPNSEMKLIGDDGTEAPVGAPGEIYVRGPNVCLGYWKNEQATRDAFDTQGFLGSGDIAIRSDEGWYWIVDRKKELIKVKGFQVAPAELEAVLLENDAVADAAVVALQVDHEELPRAYVVLKDHAKGKTSERDIQSWVASRVAKHKQLLGGVVFIVEVPKSPSGKIQRKIMREWVAKDKEKMGKSLPKAKL